MIKINSIKLNTFIVNLFSIFFVLSTVLNYYIPTAILPELLLLISILLITFQKKQIIHFDSILLVLLFMFIFFYSFLLNQYVSGDLKEAYRFLSISLLLFILKNLNLNYNSLIYFSLIITRLLILYVIYEFIVINFFGLTNDLFYKQIVAYFMTDQGQYFLRTWDFGIPLYRPFGISFQPQKSGFIFPMAIIIQFIYKKYINKNSNNVLWYTLFIFSTFLSLGKTAIILSILLVIILNYKKIFINSSVVFMSSTTIVYLLIVIYIKMISNNMILGTLQQDILAYFNLPLKSIIFGFGFIPTDEYFKLGFAHEAFFIRLLGMFGFLNYSLIIISFLYILRKKNILSIGILFFILFSIFHYAILNGQYYLYLLALVIICNQYYSTLEHQSK